MEERRMEDMGKGNMKNCKVCGAEVASNAPICPQCGAKLKKKHPVLIGVVALVFLVIVISAIGSDDEPKKVESNAPSQSVGNVTAQTDAAGNEQETKNVFQIGETAELKGVRVTLVNVTENTGSAYNTPNDGNVFVLCEFEIENNSDQEITVSSMVSFDAYCDDYVCTYSLGALLEKGDKNQLDGTVAAGKKFNGIVGYEVPSDWEELEISFTPDFWSGKDITFVTSHR